MREFTHPHRVLVVEDEPLLLLDMLECFADAGIGALKAGCAAEAFEQIERNPDIDVLFTDVNMPGGFDGVDLARHVRLTRPDMKVFVTSGEFRPSPEQDFMRFVPKPYDPVEVIELMSRLF